MCRNQLCVAILLFVLPFGHSLFAQDNRVRPTCPMNIVIAVDFSGSEREYLDEIRTVLLALTNPFELDETQLKIGIITFNRGARLVLPLTSDTQQMEEVIEALRIPTMVYATDIHAAIDLAYEEFRQRSAAGVPKYFILISDGDPHAHMRGYGFQSDLTSMERLKTGDSVSEVDPVHVFSLYTGRMSRYEDRFSEEVRIAAIQHMKTLASDKYSFFYYEQYLMLVDLIERIGNCL